MKAIEEILTKCLDPSWYYYVFSQEPGKALLNRNKKVRKQPVYLGLAKK